MKEDSKTGMIREAALALLAADVFPSSQAVAQATGIPPRTVEYHRAILTQKDLWPRSGAAAPRPLHRSSRAERKLELLPAEERQRNFEADQFRPWTPRSDGVFHAPATAGQARKPPETPAESCQRFLADWRRHRSYQDAS